MKKVSLERNYFVKIRWCPIIIGPHFKNVKMALNPFCDKNSSNKSIHNFSLTFTWTIVTINAISPLYYWQAGPNTQ